MIEITRDDYERLTSFLAWPNPAIYFAPVGTPLPKSASEVLSPAFSQLDPLLHWEFPQFPPGPRRAVVTPLTVFAGWLYRATLAERAAQARAVNVVRWSPGPTVQEQMDLLTHAGILAAAETLRLLCIEIKPVWEQLVQVVTAAAASLAPFVQSIEKADARARNTPPMWAYNPTQSRRPR